MGGDCGKLAVGALAGYGAVKLATGAPESSAVPLPVLNLKMDRDGSETVRASCPQSIGGEF